MNYLIELGIDLYTTCQRYEIDIDSIDRIIYIDFSDVAFNCVNEQAFASDYRGFHIVLTEEVSCFLKLASKKVNNYTLTDIINNPYLTYQEVKCDLVAMYWEM